jgi:transposase-like protein
MQCAYCHSEETVKNGTGTRQGRQIQRYLCRTCGKRFNDWTNTPMTRLRTPPELVSAAINVRTEGLGVRATGRSFGKSHASIIRWERRLADQGDDWSPPAPAGAEVTLEGDEVYTRVGENLPPPLSRKVGRCISLNGRLDTGSTPPRVAKRPHCLSSAQQRSGLGRVPRSSFVGSPFA